MTGLILPGRRHRLPAKRVGNAAPAIFRIVSIEDLPVEAWLRHADPIAGAGDRREVADHNQMIPWVTRVAQESKHRAVGIVEVDPLKPLPFKIDLVQ